MWLVALLLSALGTQTHGGSALQSDLGMEAAISKRAPSESDQHRVTIDLSALRPSLPGLVLYRYGENEQQSPKLVQIDLAALNPRIQPHVIWPQFNEFEFGDRFVDLDGAEAIPYLSDADVSPRKMARLTSDWLQNDVYDFLPDSSQGKQLLSLQGSLPLADEVIVPLDWEEGDKKKTEKRNVFLTHGWRPGGGKGVLPRTTPSGKGFVTRDFSSYYSRAGDNRSSSGKRRRETETEEARSDASGTRDPRIANASTAKSVPPVRIPSQESWSVPRRYWNVPHLFVNNFR